MRHYSLILILVLMPALGLVVPDIDLQVQVNNSLVKIGEPVHVEVRLVNKENVENRYALSIVGQYPQWIDHYDYSEIMEPYGTVTIPIIIVPTKSGTYEYTAELRAGEIKTAEKKIIFTVEEEDLPVEKRELKITVPESAIPGAEIEINMQAVGFTPGEAELILYRGEQEVKRTLIQINKREGVLTFSLPDFMNAGTYTLVMSAGQVMGSASFSVPEVRKVDKSRTLDNSLFGRSVTLTIKNNGNAMEDGEAVEPLLWYERFFASFEQTPKVSGSNVIWAYNLNPGQKIEFTYTVSFLPLVLFIIIVIMVVAYFAQESTIISVEKTATKKDNKVDVVITVKNIHNEDLGAIKLTDLIPPFSKASLGEDPDTKLKTTEGLVCSWSKSKLAKGETMKIRYNLTLMETIGKVHLPKCQVEFLMPNGKPKNAFSLSPYV